MNPYEFAAAHEADFLADLTDLLRIPSISTMSEHKADIRRAAEWLKAHFDSIGMARAEVFPTAGHPVVYAEWMGAGDAPTVLIYGHYDVQPADDESGQWLSNPFEPEVRGENLYARGATDDKGQTFTQIKAVHSLLVAGTLRVNVKFVVEGEEESGSVHLYPFVEQHTDLLAADVVVVSDTHILGLDRPSLIIGTRGITYTEIEVRGPAQDLHSGSFGGIVHNPVQALAEILVAMHTPDGRVAIPGFYDRVHTLSAAERADLAKVPYPVEQMQAETGISQPWGEPGYTLHERLGIRPTLEINGFGGGWTGEGGKTVIPARAIAKVSCRLVPDQDPDEVYEMIKRFVAVHTPKTVTSEVRSLHNGMWVTVDPTSPYMQAAARAYEFGFGAAPVLTREGGSIPIIGTFQKALHAPAIMMGFGLPDDHLHGPNEKYSLVCFHKGIRTAIHFLEDLGGQQ